MQAQDGYYAWQRGIIEPVGDHFMSNEFTCSCGECLPQKISIELVKRLDALRLSLGEAVYIHSGFRCAAKQAELKAQGYETAPGISQHELGNAADIATFPHLMGALLAEARKLFTSIGVARSFIHVDTRPDTRAWSYKTL